MAINKVEYGQKTLIDLTSDTVTKETLVKGTSAHNAAGEQIEGVFDPTEYLKKSGGDAKDVVSTFSSSDTDDSVSEWTSVSVLSSGEKLSSLFNKISTMFRNIRYLYKLIGSTDISELSEDGTITKSLTTLNGNLNKIVVISEKINITTTINAFALIKARFTDRIPMLEYVLVDAFQPDSGKISKFYITANGSLYTTESVSRTGYWFLQSTYIGK